jgi:hypothetical protein
METQTENQEHKAPTIKLLSTDSKDFSELLKQKIFVDYVKENSYKAIKKAISNNLDKAELFRIDNLSLVLELDKSQFVSALNSIIEYYSFIEDYDTCIKITSLISKYEKTQI